MDTVESLTEAQSTANTVYDAFISYSHAADDLLAPRLQAGLQRFAKPWWQRRALRVFRDESSLSANPHLWSSITNALDVSGWFVPLLSPDAAQSQWVNQEVEYWLANKDPERIIPVLTDGTFGWADGDITGDAIPPAMQGAFADEPRWVDLRFARTEEQVDLNNPRFSAAVADVASAIRGVPKDELESEEVRQHRRTVRTAWAASLVVFALAVAAGAAALFANSQRIEADVQRAAAEAERDRADSEADLARSQELAAASTSALEADPELATLLAALSIQRAPAEVPAESLRALRKADQANLLTNRIPFAGLSLVQVSPDERTVIAFSDALEVASFNLATGEMQWSTSVADDIDEPGSLALSPNGSIAVATGRDAGARQGTVLVLDVATGDVLETLTEACEFPGWAHKRPFSPDGSVLALSTGVGTCSEPENTWISFRDTGSWEEVARLDVPGMVETVSFDTDDGHFLLADWNRRADRLEVRSFPDLEVLQVFEGYLSGAAAYSPTGERIAFTSGQGSSSLRIHDVDTGEFLGWVEDQGLFLSGLGMTFSPDGESLLVLSEDGKGLVHSSDGKSITRLGATEQTFDAAFTPEGQSVVTSDHDKLEVWNLLTGSASEPITMDGTAIIHINPDRIMDGPVTAVHAYAGSFSGGLVAHLLLIDEATGETIDSNQAATAAALPDGRFVIVEQATAGTIATGPSAGQPELTLGGLAIWDPADGTLTAVTECSVPLSQTNEYTADPVTRCDDGEPAFGIHAYGEPWIKVSPDGSKFAADSWVLEGDVCGASSKTIRVWDVGTTDEFATIAVDGCEGLEVLGDTWVMTETAVYDLSNGSSIVEFDETAVDGTSQLTTDGRFVIGNSGGGLRQAVVIDTQDWSEVARWDAHNSRIRGVAISPDDERLVTTSEDGVVRIWDLTAVWAGTAGESQAPPLLDEIPIGIASDAHWIADSELGIALRNGAWTIVSLDPTRLVEDALDRVQRSFTPTECQAYRIDPCPTLEDMKSG